MSEERELYPMGDLPPVPPGETLAEHMETAGMSVWSVAAVTGLSRGYIAGFLHGRFELTEHAAEKFEGVTDIPARLWLALEKNYRASLAAKRRAADGVVRVFGLEDMPDTVMEHVQAVLSGANVVAMNTPEQRVETFQRKLERIAGPVPQETLDMAAHLIAEAEIGVEPGEEFQIEMPIGDGVYRFTLVRPAEKK